MLTKNSEVTIEITGMSHDGAGVGRYEGIPVFVPFAAVGDRLRAKILKSLTNRAYGRISEIITPSPDRIENDCPVFGRCGGCAYRHISYEAELRIKKDRVNDAMRRIGGLDVPVLPIIPSPSVTGYRNKAQFPVGYGSDKRIVTGFFRRGSHDIVPVESCPIQSHEANLACAVLRDYMAEKDVPPYDENSRSGIVRSLYVRTSSSGDTLVTVVATADALPGEDRLVGMLRAKIPGLKGLLVNRNERDTNVVLGESYRAVWGAPSITERLAGLEFDISPASFFQVNRDGAELLYREATDFAGLSGREAILDLYCGTGTIGLSMANLASSVTGVENVAEAVEDARENSLRNGITNAEFICADASAAAKSLTAGGSPPDVIILDPPRKGCPPELLDNVAEMAPSRVVYVSCNPATLARDAERLAGKGYLTEKVRPVDMFPRTPHVECVALLSRES